MSFTVYPNAILPTEVDSVSEKSSTLAAIWASSCSVIGRIISTKAEEVLLTPNTSTVGLDPKTPDVNGWDLVVLVTLQQSWLVIVPSRYWSLSSVYVSFLFSIPIRTPAEPPGNSNKSFLLILKSNISRVDLSLL